MGADTRPYLTRTGANGKWRLVSAVLLAIVALSGADGGSPPDDVRYLLVRKAGKPEKNYYEFAREVESLEPQFGFYGNGPLDVITKEPGGVRYGVYRIQRARVLSTTDSEKQPASTDDGAFVLVYPRDPDLKYCVKRYKVEVGELGGRKVTYTDFVDGREYSFQMTKNWPRPFTIYVVEVFLANVIQDVWQRSHEKWERSEKKALSRNL